ncbi:MAG: beta-xylosidase [Verrucomicrobia bacterium]|nr:beta-xylosidase [Verrucomicrobiota bacterium]MBL6913038.1 beta-xylosidase [Puniceicoccaceae bacterium]
MGAHSSFTVGMFGAQGGMALEQGGPADGGLYIGYRTESGKFYKLPFYKEAASEAERYSQSDAAKQEGADVIFGEADIQRDYNWATDRFRAPGIELTIRSPFFSIPDPACASEDELKFASCPVTFVELTVTNDSDEPWEVFFALENRTTWMPMSGRGPYKGAVTRDQMGFACQEDFVDEFTHFEIPKALEMRPNGANFLLPPISGLAFDVEPGESQTIRVVLGYYLAGEVTFNHAASYWYTKYFKSIDEVFEYAFSNQERYLAETAARDEELAASGLSEEQQFLIAHATRSYYGSTQWLDDGNPLWVVNEGEYLMINTLDLTVDMLFFELKFNPWTVRNVLEQFVDRYSYVDQVFSPEEPEKLYPGGISFSHDMGVGNHFSRPGNSCYECPGLDRKCFSFMTCEQLTNWILCAGVYLHKTGDVEFLSQYHELLLQCLESLLNRDHPDADKRDGLMSFESSRTEGGGEITTYDSLDHSLGQARGNVYLAGKCWASYLALEKLFMQLNEPAAAASAHAAAVRCAESLEAAYDESLGFIPAVLENNNQSAIIPAAEALVYPWQMGLKDAVAENGPFGGYIRMLKRHLQNILNSDICLYADGGWKLSSSADNSWMSKISISQFVVREILGMSYEGEERADAAHVSWQVKGSEFYACSDQFGSGKPIGSLYYPRIVSNILWLEETR